MLGLQGFGYGRKPRQFNSHPMYWNPEEEERKERLRASEIAAGECEYEVGSLIRAGRARRMSSSKKTHRKGGSTLIRSLIFLLLLGAALYIMIDCFGYFK